MLVCGPLADVVIVETVGVGPERNCGGGHDRTCLCSCSCPTPGTTCRPSKGVMEIADLVVINRYDIDKNAATRAEAQIMSSPRLLGQHGNPGDVHHDQKSGTRRSLQISALLGQGVDSFWAAVTQFRQPANRQWPNGHAAPEPGAGLDGAHRCGPQKLVSRQHPQVTAGCTDAAIGGRGRCGHPLQLRWVSAIPRAPIN